MELRLLRLAKRVSGLRLENRRSALHYLGWAASGSEVAASGSEVADGSEVAYATEQPLALGAIRCCLSRAADRSVQERGVGAAHQS